LVEDTDKFALKFASTSAANFLKNPLALWKIRGYVLFRSYVWCAKWSIPSCAPVFMCFCMWRYMCDWIACGRFVI